MAAIDPTNQGICTNIFIAETLTALGNSPTCAWSADKKTLTVNLGAGAYIGFKDSTNKTADKVKLNPDNMFTQDQTCNND
jgi:hypothetical protein